MAEKKRIRWVYTGKLGCKPEFVWYTNMQKMIKIFFAGLAVVSSIIFLFSPILAASPQEEFVSPLPISKPGNENNQQNNDLKTFENLPSTINILLLGFDGRRGDKNPRCDAIHFLSYDRLTDQMQITTIPRGTEITISKKEGVNYLSNVCHTKGQDFAVSQIEKIAGIKADYVVKLGFSQTLGILRYLNYPTTPTLQYLRNRTYGIGDWQRSHNQAVFLKDSFVKYFRQFAQLPKPLRFIIFHMVDTNMQFETASELLDVLLESNLDKSPERILLTTKPQESPYTKEVHYQLTENNDESWKKDKEYKTYQKNLTLYLENLITRAEKNIESGKKGNAYQLIKTPFSQKLWYQLDEEPVRSDSYFRLLKIYVESADDKNSPSLILDFITEMEAIGDKENKKRGEELLKYVIS